MKCRLKIEGMSCAACKAHVDKALSDLKVKGSANLVSNFADIEYDETKISIDKIIEAISNSGYKASLFDEDSVSEDNKIKDSKLLRLTSSIVLLLITMYFSMHEMLNLPLFGFLKANHNLGSCLIQMVLSLIVVILNYHYFTSGFYKLFKLKPNMDSLVALGSFVSFLYGIINIVRLIVAINVSDNEAAMKYSMAMYFESSAMIVTLVSIGKYLEGLSKKQTSKALESLIKMIPSRVKVVKDGKEVEVKIKDVNVGDIVALYPYDFVALDGRVTSEEGSVDESKVTGESLLVMKRQGDSLVSGSVNQSHKLYYEVTKRSQDSHISKMVKMVEEAMNSKMPLSRIADKVALYFVPIVIFIAIVTFIIWMLISKDFALSLDMFISVLVISCPCSLGLATPLCIMVASGMGAKKNILIKEAKSLEVLGSIDTLLIDKTGTLTIGKMMVDTKEELEEDGLVYLTALEKLSNHPLSYALANLTSSDKEVKNFNVILGKGIEGDIDGIHFLVSNSKVINETFNLAIPSKIIEEEKEGKNVVVIASKEKIYAYVSLLDPLKSSSKKAIELFKKNNIKVIMATGDNKYVAKIVKDKCGIDEFYSNMLPLDKGNVIDELHKSGKKVLMIGDGINDTYALSKADVSIACNSDLDIVSNSADIVLSKNDLLLAYNAYNLSKKTVRNIKINLLWAFLYNIIAIPLAAGLFYNQGIKMSPMLGSLCMSLSSISVCLNALRLKLVKWEEEEKMKLEFFVRDMMCNRCASHVKEALSVEGVSNVEIDLETKKVAVETTLSKEEIFKIIKKADYKPEEK